MSYVDADQIHFEDIVVGQELNRSIVTHVKVDVQDTDDKYQIKKWITLQDGVILVSEYWKEKKGVEYTSSESYIELPPHAREKKDDSAVRAKARESMEKRKLEKKMKEKPRKHEEEKPVKPIIVYSENDPDLPSPSEPDHGIWKLPEDDENIDECFEPQEILLEEDPYITEPLPPTDEDDQPQGIWGKPDDDDDDTGPVIVLPPGKLSLARDDENENFVPKGRWKPGKLNAVWPPPTKDPNNLRSVGKLKPFANEEEPAKTPRRVGRLKMPELFQGGNSKPRRARVFPKNASPGDDTSGMPRKIHPNSEDCNDPIAGVWAPTSMDSDDWAPVDVMVYPSKPNDLDESNPHGVVAIKDQYEPNDDGSCDPRDIIFCPPGSDPPDGCAPIGIWKPLPGKLNDTWPPPSRDGGLPRRVGKLKVPDCFQDDKFTPRRARVWPKSKAEDPGVAGDGGKGPKKFRPNDVDCLMEGVWATTNDPDADEYAPMDVVVHPSKPDDLDEYEPHGIVAVSSVARPDDDGCWKPKDFIFCPPGIQPPEDSTPIGVWTPGKLKGTWPPPIDTAGGNIRKSGKLKVPDCFHGNDFKPRQVKVFPKAKLYSPDGPQKFRSNDHDKIAGVWIPSDNAPSDRDWEPIDVNVYPSKPNDIDESKPHGVVAVTNTAETDDNGMWDPKDILFLPPNTEPNEDEVTPIGIWKPLPGRLNETWPPVSPSRSRKSLLVGKLPKWQTSPDWISCNAIVTSRKHAPDQNSDETPRGIWKFAGRNQAKRPSSAGIESDEDNWAPQTVCMYQDGKEPADIERGTHGIWGTNPCAEPDPFGQWKPKDLWFFGPSESPDQDYNDFVKRGKWAFQPGKLNAKWPPSPLIKSPMRVSIPKFEYWSGDKESAKASPSVGKLKIPGVFGAVASPKSSPKKLSVGKLKVPNL